MNPNADLILKTFKLNKMVEQYKLMRVVELKPMKAITTSSGKSVKTFLINNEETIFDIYIEQDSDGSVQTSEMIIDNSTRKKLIDIQKVGCDMLTKSENFTEHRLRSVGNHIIQLVHGAPFYHQDLPNVPTKTNYDATISLDRNELKKNSSRIETILRIYWKLLNMGPLEFHLLSKQSKHCSNTFDILESRLQVLDYIESLHGYCDSISKLRLILKSMNMFSVMSVYDKIISELKSSRLKKEQEFMKPNSLALKSYSVWSV